MYKEVKTLFSVWQMIIWPVCLFAISYGYLVITTGTKWLSFIVSIGTALMLFHALFVRSKRIRVYQKNLKELLKYATTVAFFLRFGKNVYYSLKETQKTVSGSIKQDIETVIEKMEKEKKLDTDHFKKYEFPALNQFHQMLHIELEKGGDAKELFSPVLKAMSFELAKRDELYRRKKECVTQTYTLIGMVAFMPVLMVFMTHDLYQQFLSYPVSQGIMAAFYVAIVLNIAAMQKRFVDISVRI
ncbi:hypothetical protein B7C51_08435 [Paenibacillus larvae subsp. pulvifaciens]|uniref:Flp pilus assembly protein TadB n=1 Tax=Paenibacillus larvae subsp. pulvifaciens TaxID=1477 RepID=A0A1V0USB4_9BACL|nr:hypothetical protein [Paenibacillus larvae]ARF67848.1 hypothetical protein B7C51_08435 [Paenibacillus larvae subsp. pulvifaciens]